MNARAPVAALAALVAAGLVYGLWPKQKLSPEQEIRALVARAVKSAEARDPSGVVDELAEGFRGPSGTGAQDVKRLLLGQFFGAKQIVVLNPSLEVTVASPTSGHFKGVFVFARDGADLEASKYEIEADLSSDTGRWKITSASWNR
ncbi:MAG: hypothetical protein U0228_18400 [Myxococcaceae bacterium]